MHHGGLLRVVWYLTVYSVLPPDLPNEVLHIKIIASASLILSCEQGGYKSAPGYLQIVQTRLPGPFRFEG